MLDIPPDQESAIAGKPSLGSKIALKVKSAGKQLNSSGGGGSSASSDSGDSQPQVGLQYNRQQFKRGGRVKRTGMAKVHRGEQVLTAKTARKYRSKHRGGKRG